MIKEEAPIRSSNWKVIQSLWGFTKSHRWVLLCAMLCLLLGTAAELGLPVLIQKSIDNQLIPPQPKEAPLLSQGDSWLRVESVPFDSPEHQTYLANNGTIYITKSHFEQLPEASKRSIRNQDLLSLGNSAIIFVVLLLAALGFGFGQTFLSALVGQRVMRDIRQKLFSNTLEQSIRFLQTTPIGKLVTRITSDVETINELFTSVLTSFVKDLALMIGVMLTLFLLDSRLALWALLAIIPVSALLFGFKGWYSRSFRRSRGMISRMNTFLSEHFSGMQLVQLFVRHKSTMVEFQSENAQLKKASLGEMYVFAVFRPLVDLVGSTALAVILWLGASSYLEGALSLGVLIAFLNLLQRFFEPVLDIADKFNIMQSAMAGGERVFELMETQESLPDTGKLIAQNVLGDIQFSDVHFAYKNDETILNGINFNIKAGEKVALVGYTGAGKSTIANLLTRLWDIQSGAILLDGQDIRSYNLASLRRAIGPIQQDSFLFADTIRENITLGQSIDDQSIMAVLSKVQADDFVTALPHGLDSLITEGASNVSSGQKQLLNFARILVQNPRVIILDEATANVDSDTEQRIQNAMHTIMEGRSSLVIAHRLSTIMDADRIVVLGSGKVLESGTHSELLARNGAYTQLYHLQFGEALSDWNRPNN